MLQKWLCGTTALKKEIRFTFLKVLMEMVHKPIYLSIRRTLSRMKVFMVWKE